MNLKKTDAALGVVATSLLSSVASSIIEAKGDIKLNETILSKLRDTFFEMADEYLKAQHAPLDDDPSQMKFSWEVGDQVVSREFARTGVKFDLDKFLASEPSTLTDKCVRVKKVYELDSTAAQAMIDEDPSLLPVFQKYTNEGKLEPRLYVRKKKEEE